MQRLLVVGGNGFVGSAVCRAAVNRGWQVVSLSRSGKPFATAEGHSPSWVNEVEWRAGTPFDASTYSALLPSSTAVVSTLGILLESDYKSSGAVNPFGVLRGIAENAMGGRGNPLRSTARRATYEQMNRDSALAMLQAYADSTPSDSLSTPSPFVYLSAEDLFRPFVSPRYIETKREAEQLILEKLASNSADVETHHREIRPVFIRPSLIYHPHINPLSTLPATILNASSILQSVLPAPLRIANIFPPAPFGAPTPAATSSLAALLTVPPIHVDTVAEAVCCAVERSDLEGVIDVRQMRELAGFSD